MGDSFHGIMTRFRDSRLYSPRIERECLFLGESAKYLWRAAARRGAWRRLLEEPIETIGFETTDVCNGACTYCAYRLGQPTGCMDMAQYEKGILQWSELGGGTVVFGSLIGDPLLDPFLVKRIEFAARFESLGEIVFDTTGILLQLPEIRDALFELASKIRIEMTIWMPAFDRERYERVRGVLWDPNVLQGISDFLRKNASLGSPVAARLAIMADEAGILEVDDFTMLVRPFISPERITVMSRVRDSWCGRIDEGDLTGGMVLRRSLPFRGIPCRHLLDGRLDILMNGDVRLCGRRYGAGGKHDELVVGNINTTRLAHILAGDEVARLCERFAAGRAPQVCRDCTLYTPAG